MHFFSESSRLELVFAMHTSILNHLHIKLVFRWHRVICKLARWLGSCHPLQVNVWELHHSFESIRFLHGSQVVRFSLISTISVTCWRSCFCFRRIVLWLWGCSKQRSWVNELITFFIFIFRFNQFWLHKCMFHRLMIWKNLIDKIFTLAVEVGWFVLKLFEPTFQGRLLLLLSICCCTRLRGWVFSLVGETI